MELHENAEKVLKSNIKIHFAHLQSAVDEYIRDGHGMGELSFINAYLSATLNAVVAYIDRLIDVGRIQESDVVEALKFANNLQKHNPRLIRIVKSRGGFEFPFCIEDGGIEFLEISVAWDDCVGLQTKKKNQKESYEKYFQQREVIGTIKPIVECLLDGREAEINQGIFIV